jgi:hypothetical protein
MLRHVALVRTHVSEELSASFMVVTRIGELGITLAASSNPRMLRRNTKWERKLVWNSELRMQRGVGVVAWGCKWPEYKVTFQASVEGKGWFVCKHVMNAEPRRQVSLGYVPKVLRSQ